MEKALFDFQTGASLREILAIACGLGGVQVVWAVIFSRGTIYLSALGLPPTLIALIWALPPLCGCTIQPLCGTTSDSSTSSWGRRRPYVLAGMLGASASILIMAWASSIGSLVNSGERMVWACAAVGVLGLGAFIQPLQMGLRSLVLDLFAEEQQSVAQAWVARLTGIGQLTGCAIGLLCPSTNATSTELDRFRLMAIMTVVAVGLCCSTTLYHVRETRHESLPLTVSLAKRLFHLSKCSPLFARIMLIQFISWIGWFSFLFYYTSIVKESYERQHGVGLATGALASAESLAFSFVAFSVTMVLPLVFPRPSPNALLKFWGFGLSLSSLLMLSTLLINNFQAVSLSLFLIGIPWAIATWTPFVLIGFTPEGKDSPGLSTGIHNLAISAPQIIAAAFTSILISYVGTAGILQLGGVLHLIASGLALYISL